MSLCALTASPQLRAQAREASGGIKITPPVLAGRVFLIDTNGVGGDIDAVTRYAAPHNLKLITPAKDFSDWFRSHGGTEPELIKAPGVFPCSGLTLIAKHCQQL